MWCGVDIMFITELQMKLYPRKFFNEVDVMYKSLRMSTNICSS